MPSQIYNKTLLPTSTARRTHDLSKVRGGGTVDPAYFGGSPKLRLASSPVDGSSGTPDTANTDWMIEIELPSHYVPGTDFTVEITCGLSRATNQPSTLDAEAFLKGADGLKSGSDRVSTPAITLNASYSKRIFAVSGSGLSPGQTVLIPFRAALNDTGFAGPSADAYAYVTQVEDVMTCYGGIAA